MRSPPILLFAVAFALAVAALSVGGGAVPRAEPASMGGPHGPASAPGPHAPALQENGSLDDRHVTIDIRLRQNGNARFTVSLSIPLEDDRDRAAFNRLAEDFEQGDAGLELGLDAFRQVNSRANETTAREMRITSPARNATVDNDTGGNDTGGNDTGGNDTGGNDTGGNDTGVLRLSFTWTNFARTDGERYRIGDAFNTSEGPWLRGLTADQTLVIRPPEGYAIHSAPAGFTNSTLRIDGPARFDPGYLQVTYRRSGPVTTTSPGDGRRGLAFPGVIAAGGVVAVLALAAYAVTRRESEADDGPTTAASGTEGAAPVLPEGEGGGQEGSDGTPGAVGGGAAGAEEDLELLSDEERVEHLLRRNGGRMKQANIVSETGWSNAKVSQLLSSMAEADRVKKLRIGRENLIALPDEDIGGFET